MTMLEPENKGAATRSAKVCEAMAEDLTTAVRSLQNAARYYRDNQNNHAYMCLSGAFRMVMTAMSTTIIKQLRERQK